MPVARFPLSGRVVRLIWVWAVIAVVGLYGLHRLALWAESRGWIYYRTKRMPSGAAGRAFMELSAIVEPEIEHVIEEIDSERVRGEQGESGEGEHGPRATGDG
ncbi:MAG TPA: hypothetical protein VK960_01945 [Acidimicrobiia bacterium]|nr:hypothetical protein [Acidimicrobiia bacterium]